MKPTTKLTLLAGSLAIISTIRALGQFAPVLLNPSSYNQDMVVERPTVATTASMDNGPSNTGESFFEQGYYTANFSSGLPAPGSTITSSSAPDHMYVFAPDYTTNNAVLIDPTITNATITLTSPQACTAFSFLVAAGNGAETVAYKVHHQDGTTDTGTFVCPDWFNNSPIAYTANGRCDVRNLTFDNIGAGNPRLYSADIQLTNTTSPVTTIDLARTGSGGHGAIFAMSASTGTGFIPVTITGYNEDMIVEAGAEKLPPNGLYTTASMDTGTANTGTGWYVKGFDPAATNTGLPAAGSTIASAAALDHQFTFAPSYTNNNVVFVDSANSGTMTWATPSKHSALSFLASAGHGPIIVDYTVNYADASTENGIFTVNDWFNNTPVAYNPNGRVDVVSGAFTSVNGSNPRLYTVDITLGNPTTPVDSVNLSYDAANTNSGLVAFFAVSGTGGAIPPVIATQPSSTNASLSSNVVFNASVSGSSTLTFHWQKGLGGLFTNLIDGGRISGSGSTNLTISNAIFIDDAYYQLIVTNAAGSATSSVAYLNVISPTPVVTVPGDPISIYNGSSPAAEVVQEAIDGTTQKYLNFGANAGFPPFVGPVGLVVTPSKGSTVATSLRLFTANDSPERDPADFILEGSNNGGATYTTIASGTVAMPDDRNAPGFTVDPINQFNREIVFNNSTAYTTYRFTVHNVKNNITANSMQVGEVQILGNKPVAVTITVQMLANEQLKLQWPQGTLQSSSTANGNYSTVTGAASPYTVTTTNGAQFYRVKVP